MINFYMSVLLSVIIILIVVINLSVTTENLMSNIGNNDEKTVTEISDNIDTALKKVEIASRIINSSQQIQSAIAEINLDNSKYKTGTLGYYAFKKKFDQPVTDIIDVVGDIHSVGIYSDSGYNFYFGAVNESQVNDKDQAYIKKLFCNFDASDRQFEWTSVYDLNGDRIFSLTRNLVDTSDLEKVGHLIVNIGNSYLSGILNKRELGDSSRVFLLDDKNAVIASNDDNGKNMLDMRALTGGMKSKKGYFIAGVGNTPMLVAYSTSAYTNWKAVAMIPVDKQETDLIKNQTILLLIGIAGLCASIFFSRIIASSIAKPINKLQATMKIAEQGYNVSFEDDTYLETKNLGDNFTKMLRNLRKLINEVYEGELRKQEAEFKAMQAQINPHFLYNTLDTINYMLIMDGKFDLSQTVVYLGDILRYSISRSREKVTVREDLQNIKKYLYIQRLRFGDRIKFEESFSEDALECTILKLLIQPVVENAIVHGLSGKRENGILKITGSVQDDQLHIQICDNGIGMDSALLKGIMHNEAVPSAEKGHTHIGLTNVSRRIKLYYGEEYGVSIKSEVGSGTCVSINLPVRRNEDRRDEDTCG